VRERQRQRFPQSGGGRSEISADSQEMAQSLRMKSQDYRKLFLNLALMKREVDKVIP
jgi:hypothetical protein